ncbi:hypothetical protein PCASD_26643 [Puccinia coronata f. sp. avenae]|uniref:Uncharacterized protein n=1 Tax=Puccinia coronata f. sp. avenae TaxID=200324 RepID=A0A2N5THI1_9BASI|nr:hypothetical protein PCASD_26643 [Puccinia coronata f. sp. avenae]
MHPKAPKLPPDSTHMDSSPTTHHNSFVNGAHHDTAGNLSSNINSNNGAKSFSNELNLTYTNGDSSSNLQYIIHQLVPEPGPPALMSPTIHRQSDCTPSQENKRKLPPESITQGSPTLQPPWCQSASNTQLLRLASSFVQSTPTGFLAQPTPATTPASSPAFFAGDQQPTPLNESPSDQGNHPSPKNSGSDPDYLPDGDSTAQDLNGSPDVKDIDGMYFSWFILSY